MTIQIISLVIVGVIVVYFLKKEKQKNDEYFGKPKKYTTKEQAALDYYKGIYKSIPKNNNLPNLQRDGFELEDVMLSATQIVYDKPIPKAQEVEKLRKGDLVKLLFVDGEGDVERMWVEIANKQNQFFNGLLRNDSFDFNDLKEGRPVCFHVNHIYEIEKSKE